MDKINTILTVFCVVAISFPLFFIDTMCIEKREIRYNLLFNQYNETKITTECYPVVGYYLRMKKLEEEIKETNQKKIQREVLNDPSFDSSSLEIPSSILSSSSE
jgi:hypothetical protein